jgi:hypothetical protein
VRKAANNRVRIDGFDLGSESDRLVKVRDGAVGIVLVPVRITSVVVGGRKLGIEPDGLAVVGDGALEIALVPVSEASSIVGLGVFGIEPDGLAVVGDGAVEVVFALIREPAVAAGDSGIFRSFAAALDDAGAGGNALIRIVPLASVPVGSARSRGRGYDRKHNGPDKHLGYAHDPLPCRWEGISARFGRKGRRGRRAEEKNL